MSPYIPALIWIVSAGICIYIARRKELRLSFLWNLTYAFLGPFAIPIVLFVKRKVSDVSNESNRNSVS